MLNVAVALSDRAIYVLSKPDSVRVPYQEVVQVEGDSRMFGWASSLGCTYMVTVRGRPKGNLCETIAHLVEKQVAHHEEMRVGDEVVVAECRPRREDGPLVWTSYHTGGLDFTDPQVQRTIRSTLAPVSDKLRVVAPFPDADLTRATERGGTISDEGRDQDRDQDRCRGRDQDRDQDRAAIRTDVRAAIFAAFFSSFFPATRRHI